ncbi:SDR family NAD(P)-dependent oxidoreductase [Tamlana sp. I1]|uniref:SDR family NAD(P)-dependent oxidoreductase n=1 Tax=Tamlana sp. I1 TaxID=2762061 RepID=UPI00188EFC78|nr:SDR family NAD(P)-dependent oxidoreductase [Tamlana sp. I1]
MNKSTANFIDELLSDSGLFPFIKTLKKDFPPFDFSKETILITGAAGTIGSELAKQLIKGKYKQLILLDVAESPLYNLFKDLEFDNTENIIFKLLDITDEASLTHLFQSYKPSLVFHTAAYKHVPLMEENPYKAVVNNILGTKLLADISSEYQVKKFVFISTDKAVNPINIMGMSKRISEKYFNYLNTVSNTYFLITRFGNIMGSNGSVVPLLKKQIESGKALTVTSEDISRYFISKRKACFLILKIAKLEKPEHNTFTFNMGNPIKIKDLAERLILNYNGISESSEIKITELRPGEKLHEEILLNTERLISTEVEDLFMVKSEENDAAKKLDFNKLFSIKPNDSVNSIKLILQSYI